MKKMPARCIDMVMTSPPYWGLRDYGFEQIFGGDSDCEHEWIDKTIIRRAPGDVPGKTSMIAKNRPNDTVNRPDIKQNICLKCQAWKGQLGLEPTPEMYIEHLTEIFNEVKRVLKKTGTFWLNLGDTYWSAKGSCFNPGGNENALEANKKEMGAYPLYRGNKSDVPNLPPKCLAMVPERLAWSLIQNGWILRNKIIWYKPNAMPSSVTDRFSNRWEYVFMFSKSQRYYFDLDAVREKHKTSIDEYKAKLPKSLNNKTNLEAESGIIKSSTPDAIRRRFEIGKNPGDVFEIATQPFPEAHFAIFPEKLCEKPIKAGCPGDGVVLDPFCGAGTALYVAKEMRRRFIGIDIKQEYCDMCEKRLAQGVL